MPTPDPPRYHLEVPWTESPFFERELAARKLSPEQTERARFFHEHGYLIVENAAPDELLDRVREQVAGLFESSSEDPRCSGARFQDAWKECPAVRELAAFRPLVEVLEELYGRRPIPFQTLDFRVGSEQRAHPDTVHFNSYPPRFLAGVWVALEDVDEDNGTLFYYPGSHRLPEAGFAELGLRVLNHNRPGALEAFTYQDYDRFEDYVEDLMTSGGLERLDLKAPKGTALIWAAGLVHGGGQIRRPGSSRWSQVTHYYFEDCLYYVPIFSTPILGDLYLKKVVDVRTGEPVTARYRGLDLPELEADGTHKLWLDISEAEGDADGADALRRISNYEIKHLRADNDFLRGVEAENANLWGMNQRLQALLDAVEASPSLRLGKALTAPLRWLRRRRHGS